MKIKLLPTNQNEVDARLRELLEDNAFVKEHDIVVLNVEGYETVPRLGVVSNNGVSNSIRSYPYDRHFRSKDRSVPINGLEVLTNSDKNDVCYASLIHLDRKIVVDFKYKNKG